MTYRDFVITLHRILSWYVDLNGEPKCCTKALQEHLINNKKNLRRYINGHLQNEGLRSSINARD